MTHLAGPPDVAPEGEGEADHHQLLHHRHHQCQLLLLLLCYLITAVLSASPPPHMQCVTLLTNIREFFWFLHYSLYLAVPHPGLRDHNGFLSNECVQFSP